MYTFFCCCAKITNEVDMEKIIIGDKIEDKKYDFRETCFGICLKGDKMLLVKKKGQYSFIGGGVEEGETHQECLKREFIEESGYKLLNIEPFVIIDCFWLAAGKWPLESLANFFVVELGEKISEPTEEGHVVEEVPIEEVEKLLPLPYHKKALELFVKNL